MIYSDMEYNETLQSVEKLREAERVRRQALLEDGFTEEEIKRALDPTMTFRAQLEDQIAWYDNARAGQFEKLSRLTHVGRLLIAARIASGKSQREFASLIGVSEAAVCRDERNEYHSITVERAQEILDLLGVRMSLLSVLHSQISSLAANIPQSDFADYSSSITSPENYTRR